MSGPNLKLICGLLLATLVGGCSDRPAERPVENVVVLCTDTIRQDVFEALSGLDDALSLYEPDALRFANAHAPAPWTIPSVAALVTGLYPAQHGAGRFEEQPAQLTRHVPSKIAEDATTFAEILAAEGFQTAAFVAHPWFAADFGLQRGFQVLHARKGWQKVLGQFTHWLDERPEGRFLGYLHLMEAHDAHLGSDQDVAARVKAADRRTMRLARSLAPNGICDDPPGPMCQKFLAYVDAVAEQRNAIAAMLGELQRRNLLDDTLVVIYSDHGEEFHDHVEVAAELAEDPRDIYGIGHGQSLFQELLAVPLVVWHPRMKGVAVEQPVSLVDVAPSILHWTGIDDPQHDRPGVLLDAVVRGDPIDWAPYPPGFRPLGDDAARPIYASSIGFGYEQMAVRRLDQKAVYYTRDDRYSFFDLRNDPEERHPGPDEMAPYLADRMIGDYVESRSTIAQSRPTVSDEQIESLQAIGYLQGLDEDKQAQ